MHLVQFQHRIFQDLLAVLNHRVGRLGQLQIYHYVINFIIIPDITKHTHRLKTQ